MSQRQAMVIFWVDRQRYALPLAAVERVVRADGGPVSQGRALVRYFAAWLWFLPALLVARLAGLHSAWQIFALMTVGVLAYALLARLHPQRQFWHDALCGTRIVTWRPAPRRAQSPA